ncbi:MAG TPA: universal stress protein [Ktedonobacteraceae bacterium]|nr:universal stress protein [Ktedonobacteraceae bacterium]
MLKRILVPLDGSLLAEGALRVAARIALASDGTILLLRVIGVPTTYTPYIYGSDMAQSPQLAQDLIDMEQENSEKYMAEIASLDILAGIQVETTIIPGSAGMSILDTAKEEKVDVIVMSSHGETGFKRFVLGSVAQYVSRHSPVPVLVLQGDETDPLSTLPEPKQPSHSITALVALDGSELAEALLEPAAYVVAALSTPAKGTLLLSTVANKQAGKVKHGTEEFMRDEAKKYLIGIGERLQRSEIGKLNLVIEWSIEESKDVANALIEAAESGKVLESSHEFSGCDLIAIATHGRGGLKRLMAGSVTENVLGSTTLPMLIVRPQDEK